MGYPNPVPAGTPAVPGGSITAVAPTAVPDFDTKIVNGIVCPKPTSYYPMNEVSGSGVIDAMGVSNGTYANIAAYGAAAMCPDNKPCPQFNGTNSLATFTDPTTNNKSWSVQLAVMVNQAYTAYHMPFATGNPGTTSGWYWGAGNSDYRMNVAMRTSGTYVNAQPATNICPFPGFTAVLVHIVYNATANTLSFYQNGVLAASVAATAYTKGAGSLWVGGNTAYSAFSSGVFGKLGIWASTALSATQVASIYNAFANSPITGVVSSTAASLHSVQVQNGASHLWRCNDAAGSSTLVDAFGGTALTVGSGVTVGVPGLLNDGATGVYLPGAGNSASYLKALGVMPSGGAWCVELLAAVYDLAGNGSNVGVVAAMGSTGGGVNLNLRPYESEFTSNAADSSFRLFYPLNAASVLYHLELNGSGNGYYYANGNLLWSGSLGVSTLSTQTLRIGIFPDDTSYTSTMAVQNIAVYPGRLTQAQKNASMSAVYRR